MKFQPMPALPQTPGMRIWAAVVGGFSFVITYEPLRDPQWHGYTASWKNRAADVRPVLSGYGGTQPANRIDGGPWRTFAEAEAACLRTWQQLRQRS